MSSDEILEAAEREQVVGETREVSVRGTHVARFAQRLAEQLQSAMETQAVIDQAIGVTMSRSGGTEAEAIDQLLALSQTRHLQLAAIARDIVDEADGWARARIN